MPDFADQDTGSCGFAARVIRKARSCIGGARLSRKMESKSL